jgi:hypothetical protein
VPCFTFHMNTQPCRTEGPPARTPSRRVKIVDKMKKNHWHH